MRDDIARLLRTRSGHFEFESRHHGERWLELERLCERPAALGPLARELADRLAPHRVDAVCGPLVEGAFIALRVAEQMEVDFRYSERRASEREGLFPIDYRLPGALRDAVRGQRVAVVNDVISAGSAVRSTLDDLTACGARPVAIAALLTLGDGAHGLADEAGIPLVALAEDTNAIWPPGACPLCDTGVPLVPHPGS